MVQFREADAQDAAAIAQLHAESWRSAYRGILSDDYLDNQVQSERASLWQSRFAERPAGSYSASLFDAGRAKILKKVNEEATEVVIAASHETRERLVSELADLVYHLSALMVNEAVSWQDVEAELARREVAPA